MQSSGSIINEVMVKVLFEVACQPACAYDRLTELPAVDNCISAGFYIATASDPILMTNIAVSKESYMNRLTDSR